jgi:hypothetical protein
MVLGALPFDPLSLFADKCDIGTTFRLAGLTLWRTLAVIRARLEILTLSTDAVTTKVRFFTIIWAGSLVLSLRTDTVTTNGLGIRLSIRRSLWGRVGGALGRLVWAGLHGGVWLCSAPLVGNIVGACQSANHQEKSK